MTPPLGVSWAERAAKDRKALDKATRMRVLDAIDRFALTGHGDIKALQGEPGSFRLRVGDYRVIFYANVQANAIVVTKVSHRREAYR